MRECKACLAKDCAGKEPWSSQPDGEFAECGDSSPHGSESGDKSPHSTFGRLNDDDQCQARQALHSL